MIDCRSNSHTCFLCHSDSHGCNRQRTHNNQKSPAMHKHTCTVPACSSFFHPVCSNPLLSTAVRDAIKHTSKQSDERTWRLKLGFCFIFFFLPAPLCLAQCVRPRCSRSFMERRWGGNLTARAGLFCQVCDQSFCVCMCVHLSVYVPESCVSVL